MANMTMMGIGSGFLNDDMLKAYREAMEQGTIKPLNTSMQSNLDKQAKLTEITTLVETLKNSFKKFNELETYMKRKNTVTGDGVTATIGAGVALQDIEISVHQLAKNDLTQLGKKFESRDSVFSTTNTTLKFNHNGKDYSIDIRAGQKLSEVSQAITDATDGAVIGVIMKTGGTQPYQLMIQSKETGEANRVYFGNTATSSAVKGGAIKGDFSIKLKDSTGNDKTLNISLDTKAGNSSQDNAAAIKKAIEDAIQADTDLKDLYDKGDLNVGLVNGGKSFVINDRRGLDFEVTAGSPDIMKDIGLSARTYSAGTDAFVAKTAMQGGHYEGKVTVGDVTLDLATLTQAGNTGQQNLTAIINEINKSTTVTAKEQDGKLVVTDNNGGSVQIVLDTGNTTAQNASIISKLGITGGTHAPYNSFIKDVGVNNIQQAQDSKFSWNGMEISRPTNTVDDVVSGISVELTKPHTGSDKSVIRITEDQDQIFDGIEEFVKAYNEVIAKVTELTRYDETTNVAGIFNGESSIRGIHNSLKSILNFSTGSANLSMSTFGFSLTDDGSLKVDKDKLKAKYKDNPEQALSFFRGGEAIVGGTEVPKRDSNNNLVTDGSGNVIYERIGGTKTEITGFFAQFGKVVDGLITGPDSTLKAYEQSLKDEYKRSQEEKKLQEERIEKRVDGIRDRLNAYDSMIYKMNQSMTQLQNIINASSGSK